MIKIMVAYQQVKGNNKLELATPNKIKNTFIDPNNIIYQDIECNLYTIDELKDKTIQFSDKTTIKL